MRSSASLLSLGLFLTACSGGGTDYGFVVKNVDISPGYQKLQARYQQELSLSRDAAEALENGVALTVSLELELRDSNSLTLLADDIRQYEISYMPLNEVYQLALPDGNGMKSFPRLRHVLSELSSVDLDFKTGPLAPGTYEFRSRTRLDNASLPAPMHLPAMFSPAWKHDSDWSTWVFRIDA